MTAHRALIDARISAWTDALPPGGLYAPMAYLMGLPAKRVRPVLTLMACELFGGRAEDALEEALGIELFHNFTLMHDDIMDAAPLRRGRPTVHEKWDVPTAILSGDALLVKAYQQMTRDPEVAALFSCHALAVCEGQRLDMEFERRGDVRMEEYMGMIRLKTAMLLSCALQVGAAVAGAPAEERERLGEVGEHLGLAFQLRDDLLDAFGDPGKVGKRPGGDLRAGKKTWLLIRGLEVSRDQGRDELLRELEREPGDRDVDAMLRTLEDLGVRAGAQDEVERQDRLAMEAMEAIAAPDERKGPLRTLAAMLMARAH